ncbi:MAG: helix-turn-helix domain-containing protein [Candidatus Thorarchaeota archaeon]
MTEDIKFPPCVWKRGRKTNYNSGMCQDYIQQSANGKTIAKIAESWGCSDKLIYKWAKDFEEFGEAKLVGDTARRAWWEEQLRKTACGDMKGNVGAIATYLNKYYGYRVPENSGGGNTININNMNIAALDNEDINKRLSSLMEKYGAINLEDLKVKVIGNDKSN